MYVENRPILTNTQISEVANPSSHKENTVIALSNRVFTICLGEEENFHEMRKVRKDLRGKRYPEGLNSKYENSITKPSKEVSCSSEKNIVITQPYIREVTRRVTKLFEPRGIKLFSRITNKLRYKVCK